MKKLHSRKPNFRSEKQNMIEGLTTIKGKAMNYKTTNKMQREPSSVGTQQVLTRFYSLNLTKSLEVNPPEDEDSEDLINHRCSCGNVNDDGLFKMTSDPESSSESDDGGGDEENTLTVQRILKTLIAAEVKGHMDPKKKSALKQLAGSCKAGDAISDVYLQQFLKLTSSHQDVIVEVSLMVLKHCAQSMENTRRILEMSAAQQVMCLMENSQSEAVVEGAVQLLHKIMKYPELKDFWLELMIVRGLPMLMKYITMETLHLVHSGKVSSLLKSICWLLSEGATYHELSVLMLDQFIPQLNSLGNLNPSSETHEPFLKLLCNIASINDYTRSVLRQNKKLLQKTYILLGQGSCLVQEKVLALYDQLSSSDRGYNMDPLEDRDRLKIFFSVMKVTHCRKLHQAGFKFLLAVLTHLEGSQWLMLLTLAQETLGSPTENNNLHGNKPTQLKEKSRGKSGLKDLCALLMQAVYSEGKIDFDGSSMKAIRFRPGIDDCETLHYIVQCFLKIISHSNHITTPNKYVSQQCRSRSTEPREEIRLILKCNVLHLLAVLNSFAISQKCDPYQPPRSTQRNIETLYLQACLKIWQTEGSTKILPLTLSKHDAEFVKDLLKLCLQLAAFSSARNLDSSVNDEGVILISDEIVLDAGDRIISKGSNHVYLENIAQAFQPAKSGILHHGKGERSHNTYHRRRKMAWGIGSLTNEGYREGQDEGAKGRRDEILETPELAWDEEEYSSQRNESMRRLQREKCREENARRATRRERMNRGEPEVIIDDRGDGVDEKRRFQKDLRKRLVKGGLIEATCSWVCAQDCDIQHLALSILHCLIQPWHPQEIKDHHHRQEQGQGVLETQKLRVEEMAASLAERDKLLSEILQQVSAQTAGVITDALGGQRSHSGTKKHPEKRKQMETANSGLLCGSTFTFGKDGPISFQVALWSLELLGPRISFVLQQGSGAVLDKCLHMIYDLATFGDVTLHLKLASMGVMSVLIEVTNRSDLEPHVIVLALKTLHRLVDDLRMKQLFLGDGGIIFMEQLKMSGDNEEIYNAVDVLLTSVSNEPGSLLY